MNEAQFRKKIGQLLADEGTYFEPVENLVSVGFPDGIAWTPKGGVPIELKYVRSPPARQSTPLLGRYGLRPEQVAWWRRYRGPGWIIVGVGRDIYAVPGSAAGDLNSLPWSGWNQHGPLYGENFSKWSAAEFASNLSD